MVTISIIHMLGVCDMDTPIFDSLYRALDSSTYGRPERDECVLLVLRRMSPGLHKCSHGGLRGFCRGKV